MQNRKVKRNGEVQRNKATDINTTGKTGLKSEQGEGTHGDMGSAHDYQQSVNCHRPVTRGWWYPCVWDSEACMHELRILRQSLVTLDRKICSYHR